MTSPADPPAPKSHRALRMALRLAVVALLVWLAHSGLDWLRDHTQGPAAGMTALALLLLVYALLLALPFIPGIEIGLTLLAMKGADAAPFVWLATVTGLVLAWALGRWMPLVWLLGTLRDLRLTAFATTLERFADLPLPLRLQFLCQKAPDWMGPVLRDWRYVALGLLLNLPGNVFLGGGGGLALLAGLSRLFTWPAVFLTFLLATAPVPLLVWVAGPDILPWTR